MNAKQHSWLTPATLVKQAIKKAAGNSFAPGETSVDIPNHFLLPSEKKDWIAPCEEEKLSAIKPMTSVEPGEGL